MIKAIKNFNKNLINLIYKNNDVEQGFFYYQGLLIDIVSDIIEYKGMELDGLTDDEASHEIEYRRITTGHCSLTNHSKFGMIACDSSLYDFDLYGNFRRVNFYNPFLGFLNAFTPRKEIGKDCVVIYSSNTEKKLNIPIQSRNLIMQKINRYARDLADIDATLSMYTINSRQPYLITTRNQQTQKNIEKVYESLKKGQFAIGVDTDLIKEASTLKNIDIITGFITELVDTKNAVIKRFLEDFGIYSTDDKKERLIVDEVAQENKNVKIFLYSFLKEAEIGVEAYNKLYGKNASVGLRKEIFDFSELFDDASNYTLKKEAVEDESERISENTENFE